MTSTPAAFGPALLALLPLREQVHRERRSPPSSSCDKSGVTLPREPALQVLVHWTSAALHKPNVLVSLRRHIKTKRDRADVSCQNINSDKACPGTKSSSGSSANGGITRQRRLVKKKCNPKRVQTHTKSTVTLRRESHFPVLVHFSGRLRLCTKAQKEANLMCLETVTAARLALPRSSPPVPPSAAQ